MTETISQRIFNKLLADGEIEEKEPGQYIWTDEFSARAKYKRFHGDPKKFAAYLDADVERVAEISKKAAELTGEIEDLAKINESLTATVNNLNNELAATRALLADERGRRVMAEQILDNIRQSLPQLTDGQSIRRFGVDLNGKRVIGYKEPEDRP